MRNNYIKGVFLTYPLDLKYESNLLHTKLIRVSQNHVFFFFLFISYAHLVHACPTDRREYLSCRVIRERFTIYTPVIMSALTPLSRYDLNDFKTDWKKYDWHQNFLI